MQSVYQIKDDDDIKRNLIDRTILGQKSARVMDIDFDFEITNFKNMVSFPDAEIANNLHKIFSLSDVHFQLV